MNGDCRERGDVSIRRMDWKFMLRRRTPAVVSFETLCTAPLSEFLQPGNSLPTSVLDRSCSRIATDDAPSHQQQGGEHESFEGDESDLLRVGFSEVG